MDLTIIASKFCEKIKKGDIFDYGTNHCPDKSANGMIAICKKTGPIKDIPDIQQEAGRGPPGRQIPVSGADQRRRLALDRFQESECVGEREVFPAGRLIWTPWTC